MDCNNTTNNEQESYSGKSNKTFFRKKIVIVARVAETEIDKSDIDFVQD